MSSIENDKMPVKFTKETRVLFLKKRRNEVMEQDKRTILRTKREIKELEWKVVHCHKKERVLVERLILVKKEYLDRLNKNS